MKHRVTTYIISAWTCDFDADSEEAARSMAYDEIRGDIPDHGYVEQRSVALPVPVAFAAE